MKKIGVLFGMERTFPRDLVDYVNSGGSGVGAIYVNVGILSPKEVFRYDVIFDRVSHEVPFYRSYLKYAATCGVKVVNNPFAMCADDNFFHTAAAEKLGVRVPKTVLLPSKNHPHGTTADSFKNLQFPLDWDAAFEYVGFPAYLKPNVSEANLYDFKIYNKRELFSAFDLTGDKTMILQKSIEWDSFYRAYAIGRDKIRVMDYDPEKPLHMRYKVDNGKLTDEVREEIERISRKMCDFLESDFNVLEFAVKDGVPYAVDFLSARPSAESFRLKTDDYRWIVSSIGDFLIELSKRSAVDYYGERRKHLLELGGGAK